MVLSFVISLLPIWIVEYLLTFFAGIQLELLAVRGNHMKVEKKKKKKKLMSERRTARRKSESNHLPSRFLYVPQHLKTHSHVHNIHHHGLSANNNSEVDMHRVLSTPAFPLSLNSSGELPSNEPHHPTIQTTHPHIDVVPPNSAVRFEVPLVHDENNLSPCGLSLKRVTSDDPLFRPQQPYEKILLESNLQHKKDFEDFMRGVKDIKDVQNWIKNYSNGASRKIAIVKISRRILETSFGISQAASALSFMYRFGLQPVVIHGGFNELAKYPKSEVLSCRQRFSTALKEAIQAHGVGATILTDEIFHIDPIIDDSNRENSSSDEEESSGCHGIGFGLGFSVPGGLKLHVKDFNCDLLIDALDKGKIPIYDSVASMEGIQIPLNSDLVTYELSKRIHPYRIILACNDGGIVDVDNKPIPVVYMSKDFSTLMSADWVTQRRKVQLEYLKQIVKCVPLTTTVVITSIEGITHQLFYPRLANETIIKSNEEYRVHMIEDFDTIDRVELRKLVEDSFGRPLVDNYMDFLSNNLYRLYLVNSTEGDYLGCAIITKSEIAIPYLCKFCVKKSAQGLGLGDLLWRSLQRDLPQLYWRSRNDNPLNNWYFQRAQGSFRGDPHFTVFWYGDDNFRDGPEIIQDALSKPVTVLPLYPH